MKTITQVVQNLVKPYIDNQDQAVESNIAPVETDATSSTGSYSQGEQLILNKILYDVTAAITVGDPLEVGTNIAVAPKISAAIGGKQEQIEVSSMPTASASNVGKVLIYIGATTSTYTSGQSYQSTLEDGNYIWKPTSISSVDASDVVYDNQTSGLTATDSQAAIDELASQNQTLTNQIDVLIENGAVNLLNFNPATVTKEETTFTRNSDKTYTVVVTATTAAAREVHASITLPPGSYKLTGTPSNGSNICRMTVYSNTESRNLAIDEGSGSEFTITQTNQCGVYIDLRTGVPAGTYVFKPMISDPSLNLSYDDYVPYAKTNKELTEDVEEVQTNLNPIGKRCFLAFYSPFDGWLGTFAKSFGISKSTTLQQLCNAVCSTGNGSVWQEAGEIVITTNASTIDVSNTPTYLQTIANDFSVSGILIIRISIINIGSGRLYVEVKDGGLTYVKRAYYNNFTLASTGVKTQTL